MGHKINVIFLIGLSNMAGISEITVTFWKNILTSFLLCPQHMYVMDLQVLCLLGGMLPHANPLGKT